MTYLGDFADDATLDFKWQTFSAAGASVTRATDGTVSVYVGNSTTQLTTGVTDTEDFDSLTGIHHCRIDLSASATYTPGVECQVVLSAATIDGQTVNSVLAHFSIERTGGALAVAKARLPASLVSGRIDASIGAAAANTITASALATDAVTEIQAAVAAGAVASVTGNVGGNVTGSVGSVVGAVGSVTGAVGSVTGAVGSVTGSVGGNVTGSVGSLAAQAKADVNAEVLDVMNVDTYAELGQSTPAATASPFTMIRWIFKRFRNKQDQTSSLWRLYSDDTTTVDQKATITSDGTTVTRGEVASGP